MSNIKNFMKLNDEQLSTLISGYETNTLHSLISRLRGELSKIDLELKTSEQDKYQLKKSNDNLSAELGKIKRKMKRIENKK